MAESQRAVHAKESRTPSSTRERTSCGAIFYSGAISRGVEMLPLGLSDQDAIASARTLPSNRKDPFDGFEVWDRDRVVIGFQTLSR